MKPAHHVLIDRLDEQIQARHLLKHPFYQAWSQGELSIKALQDYAKDYYQHVKAFCTYISAIHWRADSFTRRILLQNLIEEEAGSPNHPQLWKRFALALGVQEEELEVHVPSSDMERLIATFRTICSQHTTIEGIAALYAYESQIPEICISKIQGLQAHYSMQNPESWQYFSVHIEADQSHAAQERALLKDGINLENDEQVHSSVNKILDVLWNFLSSICHKHNIACQPI